MKRIIVLGAILALSGTNLFAQVGKPPTPATPKSAPGGAQQALQAVAEAAADKAAADRKKEVMELVREWFIRWNGLAENTPEAIERFVELYRPDGSHEMGPGEKQTGGPVAYRGATLIRKMAEDFARKWEDVAYLISTRTAAEKTFEVIAVAETPWGATDLSVEYKGGQTDRQSKKRYAIQGAAFFEIENGKITRTRLYIPREEWTEVTGPFKVM